ncbi:hypothetical protein G3I15_36030, partial [Streptomyces sp. SID10244]|nr:hypothetical protein [Streptomyces sp. SID10244]
MQGAHLADLRDLVRSRLIPGFTGLVEIEADARDWAEDAGESPDDAVGEVRRLWDDRAQAQRQWTDTGDYARLRAAFDDLDADGVLA